MCCVCVCVLNSSQHHNRSSQKVQSGLMIAVLVLLFVRSDSLWSIPVCGIMRIRRATHETYLLWIQYREHHYVWKQLSIIMLENLCHQTALNVVLELVPQPLRHVLLKSAIDCHWQSRKVGLTSSGISIEQPVTESMLANGTRPVLW